MTIPQYTRLATWDDLTSLTPNMVEQAGSMYLDESGLEVFFIVDGVRYNTSEIHRFQEQQAKEREEMMESIRQQVFSEENK